MSLETKVAILKERIRQFHRAIKLQARKDTQHFKDINHENARVAANNAEKVSKTELDLKVNPVEKRVGDLEKWVDTQKGKSILGLQIKDWVIVSVAIVALLKGCFLK